MADWVETYTIGSIISVQGMEDVLFTPFVCIYRMLFELGRYIDSFMTWHTYFINFLSIMRTTQCKIHFLMLSGLSIRYSQPLGASRFGYFPQSISTTGTPPCGPVVLLWTIFRSIFSVRVCAKVRERWSILGAIRKDSAFNVHGLVRSFWSGGPN